MLDRAGKGEFVPIGIEHMEITFAPRGILRRLGTKAAFAKVRPKAINIRNVEDKPPPANSGIAFLEVTQRLGAESEFPPLFAEM